VGIRVGFFLQLGYLGEELPDILATRKLIEDARPDDVGVSVSYPLPGTKFYEAVKQQMGTKTHWQESSDLEMMFEGTYTSEFYRALRNLLHDQVKTPDSPEIERRWAQIVAEEGDHRLARAVSGPPANLAAAFS
jgi:anaerobic magnesium-protoporphyrin IX monomethyl ester cyclase